MIETESCAIAVKPFKEYAELLKILESRHMIIRDRERALRKIEQIGYYRLSGYWHSSRKFEKPRAGESRDLVYLDEFQRGTSFEDVYRFYLMDKSLRVLLTDALERIEVYLRTIIAHELGKHNPLAHLGEECFSKASRVVVKGVGLTPYAEWQAKHAKLLEQSREQSILSHINANKPIPVWVACEAWDFGAVSRLFSILSVSSQDLICARLGISERKVVENWLINLNGVRNRCAHHARVCNRPNPRDLILPKCGYFNDLQLTQRAKQRFHGLISIIWFLIRKVGPGSQWLVKVADVLDGMPKLPGLTWKSMGFDEQGFPRKKFPITLKPVVPAPALDDVCEAALASLGGSATAIKAFPITDASSQSKRQFTDGVLDLIADI